MITREQALAYHSRGRPGKLKISPTKSTKTQEDLSLAYSPGVAEPCREIAEEADRAFKYTADPRGARLAPGVLAKVRESIRSPDSGAKSESPARTRTCGAGPGSGYSLSSSRAITRRWIWFVPS